MGLGFKTRLDALVKLRERVAESAKHALARARQDVIRIEQSLAKARARAMEERRVAGSAADWEIWEAAHARALLEIKKIEAALREAISAEAAARANFEKAHKEAEAVSRVAESKRQEMAKAAEKAERKMFDELAAMRHGRKD